MKVVIKFEKEIEHCFQCPYSQWNTWRINGESDSGYVCKKLKINSLTPVSGGILDDCPFLKKDA